MTQRWFERCRRHATASTAVFATIATAVSFISPVAQRASAGTTTTTAAPTTTTTAVPGSNCSAVESGFSLDRTGWTASSNAPSSSADAPANALDGNYSSRFSTDKDQTAALYFEVNLGSAQSFNELKMSTPGSPTDYARGFDIYVSTDGSSWTKVASCTGQLYARSRELQPSKRPVRKGRAQYERQRLVVDRRAQPLQPDYSTDYNHSGPHDDYDSSAGLQLLGRRERVHASTERAGQQAATLLLRVRTPQLMLSTATTAAASAQTRTRRPRLYFEVNLGSAQSFNELKMSTPGSPTDYARGFDVYVSNDGSSWTKVAELHWAALRQKS